MTQNGPKSPRSSSEIPSIQPKKPRNPSGYSAFFLGGSIPRKIPRLGASGRAGGPGGAQRRGGGRAGAAPGGRPVSDVPKLGRVPRSTLKKAGWNEDLLSSSHLAANFNCLNSRFA